MKRARPLFVAEVSSNHHRNLERCLAFVDTAADMGCDGVKFQLFRIHALFAPEILARSAPHRARASWELPAEWLAPLAERAHARGLLFACTPFDLEAVGTLAPFVDFYKVASYELLWDPLLEACARSGRPLALSTGMAELAEVEHAVAVIAKAGCADLTLLHCVSGYPTPPGEANLAALDTLRTLGERFPCLRLRTGWSDHSVEPGVIQRAVHRWGASLVEFHLDLDASGAEYASGHCWLPGPMAEVIRQVRVGVAADGTGRKLPAPSELSDRDWRADPSDGLRPLRALREDFRP